MPARNNAIELDLGADWKRLQAKLKKHGDGKLVRKEANRMIRALAKPVVADLAESVLKVDSDGKRGGGSKRRDTHNGGRAKRGGAGLRATISRSIQTKIMTGNDDRQGVRIRVDGGKLPPEQRGLPKYMEGRGRLRHPVVERVGRPVVRVTQTFSPQWWQPVVDRHRSRMRTGMRGILDYIESELSK